MRNLEALVDLHTMPHHQSSPQEPWKPVEALPALLPQAQALTPELAQSMLPESIQSWVTDVSERLQVPAESVAVAGIGAIASLIGRRIGIHPKREDDWLVLPVLWTALVARPSKKKSATISEALRPIERLEELARAEFEESQASHRAKQAVLKAKVDAKKDELKAAAKAGDDGLLMRLQSELVELEKEAEAQTHFERRYRTSDATVEKLAELLKENPNGLLVTRDELSGWMRSLDRSGHEGDREFFLEAWNGKGAYRVDRIGRGTISVPALCLYLFGGIQPGKLQAYVEDAERGGSGDDGLLQRIQLLVFPEQNKPPERVDRRPDIGARERLDHIYRRVSTLTPSDLGLSQPEGSGIAGLRFSPDAQALFDTWLFELETRLYSDTGMSPSFESHLAKYRSLMPSLALVFHLIDWAEDCVSSVSSVSLDAARRAAAWCAFLESHAKKVYAIVGDSQNIRADALARKIKDGKVRDGDSLRSIYRNGWSLLDTAQNLDAAVVVLERCNWVRTETQRTVGAAKDILRLNPSLTGGACE